MAILGSRSLSDERVTKILLGYIKKLKPSHLTTSGQCEGVSAIGRSLAKVLPIPIILHYLDPKKAQGKYEARNIAILKDADIAILIHDGVSIGTLNELELCKKMNIMYFYEKLEKLPEGNIMGADPEDRLDIETMDYII